MRASEFRAILRLLIFRPLAYIGGLIEDHIRLIAFWAGWSYCMMLIVGLPTNSVKMWLLSCLVPPIALLANAPILAIRKMRDRQIARRQS